MSKIDLKRLWDDDDGFVVSTEVVFLFTIVVLGLIVGWNAIRDSVFSELADIANAFQAVDQSYTLTGLRSSCVSTALTEGSGLLDPVVDALDVTDIPPFDPVVSEVDGCILAPTPP